MGALLMLLILVEVMCMLGITYAWTLIFSQFRP
jgi:hypothetical protein